MFIIYYKRARYGMREIVIGLFERVSKSVTKCSFAVVSLKSEGLIESSKRTKILKSGVDGASFMGLGAFRCDCEEGVQCD